VPHKGVQYLIRAAGLMKDKDVKVLIVGDGPLMQELRSEVKRTGVEDRVSFAGKVSYKELPSYLAACDIFTLPSTSRLEAFGIAALEAMSSGKPVVVSDIPGVREVVQDGQQGYISKACSPEGIAEKVKLLHDSPTDRKRMGEAARRTVEERYCWEKVVQKVEEVYTKSMKN
jgi:glycosyltransferase involved in cell wall biosynthesis